MALVIEDGTGMPTAQSAASAADVRAYAALRGISVPAAGAPGDLEIEQKLIVAMDYLQTGECYKGYPVNELQGIPFPRKCVYVGKTLLPSDSVPNNFKTAQIILTLEALKGTVLMPTISGTNTDYVVREEVGPIKTEYADPTKFNGRVKVTAADALLASLIGGDCCPQEFGFTVFRV